MIDMCDNWLRVERIELTVFVDNEPAVAVYVRSTALEIEATGKKYGSATVSTLMFWRSA